MLVTMTYTSFSHLGLRVFFGAGLGCDSAWSIDRWGSERPGHK